MTNETILKQAIEKAVKNGYGEDYGDIETRSIVILSEYEGYESHDIEHLIFSHDFAKAFWGENHSVEFSEDEIYGTPIHQDVTKKDYLYHLSEMVREKEPLLYLKKYL